MDLKKWFYSLNNEEKNEVAKCVDEWKSGSSQDLQLTNLRVWASSHKDKMSVRLSNALSYICECCERDNEPSYLERVTRNKFLRYRNVGPGSWNEFEKLRGF